jgi:hypothetical protein
VCFRAFGEEGEGQGVYLVELKNLCCWALSASSNKHQATSNKQQASSNKQQATSIKQQASSNKQQASNINTKLLKVVQGAILSMNIYLIKGPLLRKIWHVQSYH